MIVSGLGRNVYCPAERLGVGTAKIVEYIRNRISEYFQRSFSLSDAGVCPGGSGTLVCSGEIYRQNSWEKGHWSLYCRQLGRPDFSDLRVRHRADWGQSDAQESSAISGRVLYGSRSGC